jgi:hypothetical protein
MFCVLVVNPIFQSFFSIIGRQLDFATVFFVHFSWFVIRCLCLPFSSESEAAFSTLFYSQAGCFALLNMTNAGSIRLGL